MSNRLFSASGTYTKNSALSIWEMTYLDISMDVIIDSLGVCHVLEHDIANLQGSLSEAKFEQLDRTNL